MAAWNNEDRARWFREQTVKRSYVEEIVPTVRSLSGAFDVSQYGVLTVGTSEYPVFLVKSRSFDPARKTILITGGVHGYETSGVHGALAFMEREGMRYSAEFNLLCAPCISPWAYETINRWNPGAIDPNRSFVEGSPAEECALFLRALAPYRDQLYAHFDLHETTDTDNTVFRPAKAARDGAPEEAWSEIPDGFYTVGDSGNPSPEFQAAVIAAVKKVTHIAPPDAEGKIIGAKLEQEGVIHYPFRKLGLCAGFSPARFTTTTEVYPDSPRVTAAECVDAQVAAVRGGLDFIFDSRESE